MRFPKVQSTFGITPYNPERDTDEKRRAIFEHYQSQMGAQPLPPETLPWNRPFPPGVEAQQAFDTMLQERVVDPLARAGYEDLGAGLAAIPSAAHEMIVPQTEFDVAGTIIPLPGVAKAIKADKRAFPEITKAMRAEKKAKDVREYSRAIKALRGNNANLGEMDDVDLGAIKTSPDIKVTPGMAQKNFDASRNEAIDQEKFKMGTRPLSENPRSTEVTGIDGGVFAYRNDDSEFDRLLTLNKDLPGLEKLIKERAVLLRGYGRRTPSYYRETPGLRKIESEIAKILKENQNDLELPEYLWPLGKQVTPKDILLDKIMERDQINWSSDLQNRIDAGEIKNQQYRDQIESERLQEEYRKDKWSKILREDEEIDAEKNQRAIDEARKRIEDKTNKPKLVDPTKPPKGDPEASRSQFPGIRSQLDIAPSRMNERGEAFGDVGQSDFMPYERPGVPQFEDVQKRNYVERDLDPKEKMWNEILASDPELRNNPDYLRNLRNYFDNRWEQAQGTAEGHLMQFDMPMSEKLKPRDEKSVTSGYIDELAFKRFAEPYDKTIQAERALAKNPGDKPVRAAIIDDKIQSYFGDEIKSPGRRLQDKMYPKKQMKPELEAEGEVQKPFEKTKKAISKKAERDWVIVDADSGEDVTHLWQKDLKEGMTRQDAEEMFRNNRVYHVSDKYKKSDLKFIKKYGLEDIDNRTWSSVDPDADTEFGTCDLTGKKGPLVRMTALDKNGDEVEMEVLEDIAHKLHGLSGAY